MIDRLTSRWGFFFSDLTFFKTFFYNERDRRIFDLRLTAQVVSKLIDYFVVNGYGKTVSKNFEIFDKGKAQEICMSW
jgi:hypothetical protein